MPYPKEFPHQLFGLERGFSQSDLLKAMAKALKQRGNIQVAKLQAARAELSDREKRLEYEILLSDGCSELERALEQLSSKLVEGHFLPQSQPVLSVPKVQTDLINMNFEDDFSEVDFDPPEIILCLDWNGAKRANLPIIFDK
jgi:hypothetical protein